MSGNSLFVGFEVGSGVEVEIPIFHTLTTGQTQLSGKTTVQKTLARALAGLDYKVLVIDTKENLEDYRGFGEEIPICLRESTDPLVLLPMLESIFQRRLPTGYYSVLCELTGGTKTYSEVIKRAKEKEKSARSGWVQGACRTLYDLLERLEEQLTKVETVEHLELPYPINRLVLNQFPQASQQLFVKNAFEDVLRIHNRRSIPMLDEAYKFIPQYWGSACAKSIQDAITQTAGTETYVYLATQYLATTNKSPLKACAVRLLGTQDHKTEAQHTLDLIPFKGVATLDDIMTLPLGTFFVSTKKWAKRTYFVPYSVPRHIGQEVALGKKTSEFVKEHYLVTVTEGDTNLDYKDAFEKEKQRREKAEKDLLELQRSFSDMRTQIHNEVMAELQKTLAEDYVPKAEHLKVVNELDGKVRDLHKELGRFTKIREFFAELVQDEVAKTPLPPPQISEATATLDTTSLIAFIDERVNERIGKETKIEVVTVNVDQRVKELIKNEFLQPIINKTSVLSDLAKRAARFIYDKKLTTAGDLYSFLYPEQKTGRPRGTFQIHVTIPLEQASLINVKEDKINWNLPQTLSKLIEDPKDVEKIEKYIVSLLL